MEKKALSHRKCVKSDLLWLRLLMGLMSLLPICIVGSDMTIDELLSADMLFPSIMMFLFVILGVWILITAVKIRTKLASKQYFIYVDTVIGKDVSRDDDSTSYRLCFANNTYKKGVGKKKFYQTQIGHQYYLVQIVGAKSAIAAFDTNEWYIDESTYPQFRQT